MIDQRSEWLLADAAGGNGSRDSNTRQGGSIAAVGVLMWAGPRFAETASILPDRLDGSTNKIFIDKKWQRRSRSEGWELRQLKTGEARDLQL